MPTNIWIYDNMRSGFPRQNILGEAEYIEARWLEGFKMYAVGKNFPCVIFTGDKADRILAEKWKVYEVEPIESHLGYPKLTEKMEEVENASIYVHDHTFVNGLKQVHCGDWVEHLLEVKPGGLTYSFDRGAEVCSHIE